MATTQILSSNKKLQIAMEELQSANEDLSNLLAGLDIAALVLDAGLNVRRFTASAGKLFNLIPTDVGRPFNSISSNLDVSDWEALFSEAIEKGRQLDLEARDRNGHRYSLHIRPYKGAGQRVEGVLLKLLDTESMYQAREKAQASSDVCRAIVQTVNEAMVVLDPGFNVIYLNRSYCSLFQVTPDRMEGVPFFGRGVGQCSDAQLKELLREVLLSNSEVNGFEVDQKFPQIGRRRLLYNARQIDSSNLILVAIQDITARSMAQEKLRASESTVRALLEASGQSIAAVKRDGTIALANRKTEEMFGYSREELIGQRIEILVPQALRERHLKYHRAYFKNPVERPLGMGLQMKGQRKNGTTFPIEVSLSSVDTAEGRLAVAFVTDITVRTRLEQEAAAREQQVRNLASGLLRAQEEERHRVSRDLHDRICQQLASLAIDVGTLISDPPNAREVARPLRKIQARIVKASEEARHLAYELHPSVLDDLGPVASLRALSREFASRHGIVVEFKSGKLPGPVPIAIASCLYRVAQEALQNVAKHARATNVNMRLSSRHRTLTLQITDDGVGFNQFEVRGRGGLGLLSMEKRARLVDGDLAIKSQPGTGTRLILNVPLPETNG